MFCVNRPAGDEIIPFFCDGDKDFAYYLVLNKTDSLSVIFHDLL